MSKFAKTFRVEPGSKFALENIDPKDRCGLADKEQAKVETAEHAEAINLLQDKLYAEGQRALLVILQGMDCSGKDGVVRGVFNAAGPLGVHVHAFNVPTEDEAAQDYLWRIHKDCPPRGIIGIFNRSHYEDVLVVKVRGYAPADAIEQRYDQINQFEKLLTQNGTTVLKFMLHISKEEQAERLQARIDEPDKRWKFNPGDLEDRKRWPEFMDAYETALKRCSTEHALWHVIPSDRKWVRNLVIAKIVRETLEAMDPKPKEPKGWDPTTMKVE
jgi:PPK2 family polyphosphate:nucleotide phosphotransferase